MLEIVLDKRSYGFYIKSVLFHVLNAAMSCNIVLAS